MKTLQILTTTSAVAIAALFLFGVASEVASTSEETVSAASEVRIQVAKPVVDKIIPAEQYPAVLEAVDRVVLVARVSGYLDSIEFVEGEPVKKGDLLFRIDPRPYQAELVAAEAALAMVRADADLAQTESDRAQRLVQRKAIPVEDADRRTAQAVIALARVQEAEARLNTARLNIEFTQIRAPFDGLMSRSAITKGNLVTPSSELAVIVAMDRLYVRFNIDEHEYLNINKFSRKDWSVNFVVEGLDDMVMSGPVTILGNEIYTGTGTVSVRGEIENINHALLPGMFGEAEFQFGREQSVLLIDEKAIGTDKGQRYVLIVNDEDTVEYRPVVTGNVFNDLRVIKSGISESDRLVVNGLMRVRPGISVVPVEVSMTKTAATLLPSLISSSF